MTTPRILQQTLKLSLALYLTTQALSVSAQEFTHKAKIQAVPKNGFYRIPLNPNMAAQAKDHWEDIRLFDAKGKEIPYLLKPESPYQVNEDYESFNIATNESNDTYQTIIIENPTLKKINRLLLDMNNAETNRMVRISGSKNKTDWFTISDSLQLTLWGQTNESVIRKAIDFPTNDYPYFKLEIKRQNKEALNITQVGFSRDTIHVPAYQRINNLQYTTKQEGSKTIINVTLKPRNHIDQLRFYVREPQYKRHATIKTHQNNYNKKTYTLKRERSRSYEPSNETQLTLSSKENGTLFTSYILGENHQTEFSITIENNSNQPLSIDSLVGYQLNTAVCAELKAGAPYFLYLGDSNLSAPMYDLVYFEKNIPKVLPNAVVEPVKLKSETSDGEYNGNSEKYRVWVGMGLLAAFLLFITRNLMKKIEN